MKNQEILRQGAEGRIYETDFLGQVAIVKERFKKTYRHPILDEKITKERLKEEARTILRVFKAGIDVPTLFHVDMDTNALIMERINGITTKQYIDTHSLTENESLLLELAKNIGRVLAKMHDANIIHGDLTTSNMMLRNGVPQSIVMIDFGLSFVSTFTEDRAVDLYVLERAFQSTHASSDQIFAFILDEYKKSSKNGTQTLRKLDSVRLRGRKREMIG